MKSLQTKLTITILVIVLIALSSLGALNYWKAREIVTENITSNMAETAVNAADGVGSWLEARRAELAVMAVAPVVRNGDPAAIMPFLASVAKENKAYNLIGFAGPNGISYNSFGKSNNINSRDYFQTAIKGESGIFDPVFSMSTGVLATVIAIPVKNDDKIIGVLYGSVDMKMINKIVLDVKVGKTGYALLAQKDGLTIIHPDKEVAMKVNPLKDPNVDPGSKALTERVVNGEQGIVTLRAMGVDRYYAYAPVPGVKWGLAITVPVAEVTGAISSLTVISGITIILVLVLTALAIAWLARRIAKPIREIETIANRIAAGDIAKTQLIIASNDEIGRLGKSVEQMTHNLRDLIRKILGATEQVAASSQEMTASSDQSAQAANQIASSIVAMASGTTEQMELANDATLAVERMTVGVRQIAANANQAANQSAQAVERANEGEKAVAKAVDQMDQIETTVISSAQVVTKLGERSKEIGQIVDAISNIAGQTNLLALNAAIEAARAGEQGRGFAVVADEVRKLAEQSQEAAKKIAELIGEIKRDTDKAVVAMDNGTREVKVGAEVVKTAGVAFQEIAGLISEVSSGVEVISTELQQLVSSSQQIVNSVQRIDGLGKKTAGEAQGVSAAAEQQLASMQEIAAASQTLAKLAQDLQTAVNVFRF